MKDVMGFLKGLDKSRIYSNSEVNNILEKIDLNQFDYEVIEGVLVDSYLIDISCINSEFDYCLFLDTFLTPNSSGLSIKFVKDYTQIEKDYSWIAKEIDLKRENQ